MSSIQENRRKARQKNNPTSFLLGLPTIRRVKTPKGRPKDEIWYE